MLNSANIRYFSVSGQPFEIILCQNSSFFYPLHNHVSVYTAGLVLQGSLVLGRGANSCVYRPGGVFVIPPYQPHFIQAQKPCSLLTVCIDKQSLRQQPQQIHQQLTRLLTGLKLAEAAAGLLACLKQQETAPPPPAGHPAIRLAQKRLESFPESSLSVAELAQSAYLSQYYFIRCFKRAVGLTPHQFQIQNRVRKAQRLLRQMDSITKVALLAGFYDQSHFIKHFNKILGLTPGQYKQACRQLPPS